MKNKTFWIVLCAVALIVALLIWQPWSRADEISEPETTQQAEPESEETPAQNTEKEEPAPESPSPTEKPAENETDADGGIPVDESEEGATEEADGNGFAGF